MYPIRSLHSFEQLKLLADPHQLTILRLLLSGPASLTTLGRSMGHHPAWVRHHLKQLENAGLVELVETRIQSGVVEKFYRASASGFLVQELIVPKNPVRPTIIFSGSHDLAVELLASQISPYMDVLILPIGSLDGLVALRQNLSNLSGSHLLDPGGEYNLPFLRHFFPDRAMQVVTLAHREQGLMLTPGNPKSIRSLADLTRSDVTFINRNPGSGTRLWFDLQIQNQSLPSININGYQNHVSTHTESARMVRSGKADAAIGLKAAAHQIGLDFIPLFHERYDIVFSKDQQPLLIPILDLLQTSAFRRGIESLTGYETMHTGEQILL